MKIPINAPNNKYVQLFVHFPATGERVRLTVYENGDVVVFGKLHVVKLDAFGREVGMHSRER